MDAACGEQQALRAIRLDKGAEGLPADFKMWKDFKSRATGRHTRLNGPH